MASSHVAILLHETIDVLKPQPGEIFIDGTYGGGGHTSAILERINPDGRLLAVDWNEQAIRGCTERFDENSRVTCAVGNFAQLVDIAHLAQLPKANGLLLDLGLSSDELQRSGRGFSFNPPAGGDEPLLMTYNDTEEPMHELLKRLTEKELADIIYRYGEERNANRIAHAIKEHEQIHPIETSGALAAVIISVSPRRGKIHPATRTFMALRIAANNEMENLQSVLNDIPKLVTPGGRVAIISFHSLEDRIVKQNFREMAKQGTATLLTKKPIKPSREEILTNPRSRSAKLRAVILNS